MTPQAMEARKRSAGHGSVTKRDVEQIFAPLPECKPITLVLREPPSANRYWRHNRGRTHLSEEAVDYRQHVANECLKARILTPMECEVAITLRWFRSRKSGDLDNRLKQTFDALQGCVLRSDAQIVEIHAYRDDTDRRNPRAVITLTPTES